MVIKSFKATEKRKLETYLAKFRKVCGYSPAVKLTTEGSEKIYRVSILDAKVQDYLRKHALGLI